jgi:hypothetical protein
MEGNSLVLKDGITDIVVAGAGEETVRVMVNTARQPFGNATTMTYSDYSYLGTDPRLTFFTRPDYFPNVALIGMKDHNNASSAANIFYGFERPKSLQLWWWWRFGPQGGKDIEKIQVAANIMVVMELYQTI